MYLLEIDEWPAWQLELVTTYHRGVSGREIPNGCNIAANGCNIAANGCNIAANGCNIIANGCDSKNNGYNTRSMAITSELMALPSELMAVTSQDYKNSTNNVYCCTIKKISVRSTAPTMKQEVVP
ncbi:hypothetical protein Btru_058124 [Bulinus truncatus]|nr:hypothetical protein Btru_058124 [Bulinus truncatus]